MHAHTFRIPSLITLVIVVTAGTREEFVDVSFLFGLVQVHSQCLHKSENAFTLFMYQLLWLTSYDSTQSVSLIFDEGDKK